VYSQKIGKSLLALRSKDFFYGRRLKNLSPTQEHKKEQVARYVDLLKKSQGIVLAEYGGMAMPAMNSLRAKVRDAQGNVHVVKNTLAERALKEAGLPALSDQMVGTTIMAFGTTDIVAVAKAIVDSGKESPFVKVKGGLLGSKVLSAADVKMLATLPPLPVVRGQLAGVLKASAGKLVGVISAPARNVVGVLTAYSEKQEAAA
jgi:large subunit ribosomal protein L10